MKHMQITYSWMVCNVKILEVTMLWHTNDVTGTPDDRKGKEVEGSRSKLDRVLVGNGKSALSFDHGLYRCI